ncbi:hypothetical protein Anas_14714, partial [Armadillidium nasatum]
MTLSKGHKKPILKSLIKITPYLQQKYCLKDGKNLFICTACIKETSLFKKNENENLIIETDSKIDITVSLKLFNNVGTQCNISYRKSFDKGIQCNYTESLKLIKNDATQCNISYRESFEKGIQCNFPAKSIGIQCSSNTSNTPRKIRLRKEVHRKACHIKYLKVRNASLKS